MSRGPEIGSVDATLEALADESRRLVVRYLRNRGDDAVHFDELVEHVSTHGSDRHDSAVVAVRLYHVGLPKLAEVGLLEYDPRSDVVRYSPNSLAEELLDLLE